ncbi:MAG TPA: DUF2877 domain-containing protein [Anaerolineales bacterium]|nr:DUF2877 domain-containing protein [Anaerolineales bacterium]
MLSIRALSLAPAANDWLTKSCQPRILHVFNQACNLLNEHGEVLSVVTPQIGNGPFNLVVEDNVLFSEHVDIDSSIVVSGDQLIIADLTIHAADGKPWSPRPDWESLHHNRDNIANQLIKLPITDEKLLLPHALTSSLTSALVNADSSIAKKVASQLAGLGAGLTPAGDDFIVGAMYAARIIHPAEVGSKLAREIANTAAPLTTSLSAGWLRAAGRGELGILWHRFFDALASGDVSTIQLRITRLLSVGHTSGADALAGFIGTFLCWAKKLNSLHHNNSGFHFVHMESHQNSEIRDFPT